MVKKLPAGVESFEDFSMMNYYYVDKTMFIAELLQNIAKVNLFTRPRRFGKTLTMDMLKCFFEIGADKKLFEGLKISQETDLCEEYMGQYPVISVTLKSVEEENFLAAKNALIGVIGDEALRFEFLRESSRLTNAEKAKYAQITKVSDGGKKKAAYDMSDTALKRSLQTLTKLLFKHYWKKVILLIDECDVPLDQAFQNGYYKKMISLIRSLFGNALKTNHELEFAVITGCLRISKESIFTGMNNLKVWTITDNRFSDTFGFTENEVEEMMAYYGVEDAIGTMRDWYDGYRFGGKSLYCPWDVINYTDALRCNIKAFPENYWANTSGNEMIRRFIDKADQTTRDEIERLIAGESVRKTVSQELTYRELDNSIENLWSVLLMTGYLTATDRFSAKEFMLSIPNAEINDLFITHVKKWFKDTSRADLSKIETFCAAFPRADVKLIGDMLHDYLWDSISVRDTAVRKSLKENFPHVRLITPNIHLQYDVLNN